MIIKECNEICLIETYAYETKFLVKQKEEIK